MEFDGETWYLARRNAQTDAWHPANDNALGTQSYGNVFNNPTGSDTFSIKYDQFNWGKIMFAWGTFEHWIILDRSVLENSIAEGACAKCMLPIYKSSEPDDIFKA